MRASIGGVASVATTTAVTWESPTFVYDGVAGQVPTSLALTLDTRNDAGALLELLASSAIRAELVDTTAGTTLEVFDEPLESQPEWTTMPAAAVAPTAMTIGHTYAIRVVLSLEVLAGVIPGGSFDLDNVVLRATRETTEPTPTTPTPTTPTPTTPTPTTPTPTTPTPTNPTPTTPTTSPSPTSPTTSTGPGSGITVGVGTCAGRTARLVVGTRAGDRLRGTRGAPDPVVTGCPAGSATTGSEPATALAT